MGKILIIKGADFSAVAISEYHAVNVEQGGLLAKEGSEGLPTEEIHTGHFKRVRSAYIPFERNLIFKVDNSQELRMYAYSDTNTPKIWDTESYVNTISTNDIPVYCKYVRIIVRFIGDTDNITPSQSTLKCNKPV